MSRFVSEPIEPILRTGPDAGALSEGIPSLPEAFRWRGQTYEVLEVLGAAKSLRRESFSKEKYLRRHEWRLRMEGGDVWEVYFVRHGKRSEARAPRWFLKTVSTARFRRETRE